VVQGQPAIVFDDSFNTELTYCRSSTATGTSASDWSTKVDIDGVGATSASGASLAIINGNPAVAYYYFNGASVYGRYSRSNTTGGNAADWSGKVYFTGALVSGAYLFAGHRHQQPGVSMFTSDVAKLQYVRAQ
jgi:hypothetical protein